MQYDMMTYFKIWLGVQAVVNSVLLAIAAASNLIYLLERW